jgi:hypothetical protein
MYGGARMPSGRFRQWSSRVSGTRSLRRDLHLNPHALDHGRLRLATVLRRAAAGITGIARRHPVGVSGFLVAAIAGIVALRAIADAPRAPVPVVASNPDSTTEATTPPETQVPAPPIEGNPWDFYARGDWKNAAHNFGRVRTIAFEPGDPARLDMGRGVAAFKAAAADQSRFDAALMDTAVASFGAALISHDPTLREDAHYNLANALFERAKAAEKQRDLGFREAKSKKAKKRHAITLTYLDRLIRQLENCLEHYQETLLLNATRSDAGANHDSVLAFVKQLREIRKGQARLKMKGNGTCEDCEGECEGDCEGDCDHGGNGKPKKDKSSGQHVPGDGETDTGAKAGKDESNKEFDGTPKAKDGSTDDPGGSDPSDEADDSDPANSPDARNELIRRLKSLSQELPIRERNKNLVDQRPPNDW